METKSFKMNRLFVLAVALMTLSVNVWGDETYNQTFSYGTVGTGWSLTDYSDVSSASYYLVPNSGNSSIATLEGIFDGKNITSAVVVTINSATYGSGTNPKETTFQLYNSSECTTQVSATKGGTLPTSSDTYTDVTYTVAQATAVSKFDYDLAIKITKPGKKIRLNSINVSFTYTPGTPTPKITKVASLSNFTYVEDAGPSVSQTFTVSGTGLTNDLVVTAPANFEVCKTENGTYTSSVSFTPSSGSVTSQTVYVRMVAGLAPGTDKGGNIALTSTGASSVDIAITGDVSHKPYVITWIANTQNYTVTYVEYGETLALPNADPSPATYACPGKVFRGWTATENYSSESIPPTFVYSGSEVSSNATYYAVFADATPGVGAAGNSIKAFATGDFYMVDTYDNKYYAMSGAGTTYVASVDVTEAVTANLDGTITLDKTNPIITSAMVYTIGGEASAATVQNGGTYIGGSGSTDFSTTTTNKWSAIVGSSQNANRITFEYSARCILYRNSYDFRNYGVSNKNTSGYGKGYLYVIPTTGGLVYSNYQTQCASYTITWKSNGAQISQTLNVSPGQSVTPPTYSTIHSAGKDCNEHLMGWTATQKYKADTAPEMLAADPGTPGNVLIPSTITSDVTYYAVYADVAQEP